MRILLIEDNEELGAGLTRLLEGVYAIDHVLTGEDGLSAVQSYGYDLIVLDLSLPDMDGIDVLREIRARRLAVPVLILTARDDLDDRVLGLDLGADDYMTKPFEQSELEARIRAAVRRVSLNKSTILDVGALRFDLRNNTVTVEGRNLELTARETMVLRSLIEANGRLTPKSQLLDAITNLDMDVSENAVEQYVSRLRKKIEPFGLQVHAVRGLGYYLREEA